MTDKVTVTIIHTPARKFWLRDRRWQPYHWIAYTDHGEKVLAVSEFYSTKEECVAAIWKLFGTSTDVWLKEGHYDANPWALRKAVR